MSEMIEIRWHARGGQGAKTAATFLAEAAVAEGKFSQGFPDYGPERMGAPMRGFTRISERPVRLHCAIERPDVVMVLDETLLGTVDVLHGLKAGGVVVINTDKDAGFIREGLSNSSVNDYRLYLVNATKISLEEMGRPIPNTPMIGALVKVTGVISLKTALDNIRKKFGKKFPEKVVEANVRSIERAYNEVREV